MKTIDSLAALMDEADKAGQNAGSMELGLAIIRPDPAQPRRTFDEEKLNDLAASISAQGVIQPIVVRSDTEAVRHYIVIAGERRWRAAKIAGLDTIPAVVREPDSPNVLAMQLIENINRENIAILEEAEAVARLVDQLGKAALAANALGKPAGWVSQRRKIAKGLYRIQPIVDSDATRDPETLCMLLDLAKLDEARFEGFLRRSQIARTQVREALDIAKGKQSEPSAPAEATEPVAETPKKPSAESEADGPRGDSGVGESEKVSHVKPYADAQPAGPADDPNVKRIAADLSVILGQPVSIDLSSETSGEVRIPFDSLATLETVLSHIR